MRDYQLLYPFTLATDSLVNFLLHVQIVTVVFLPDVSFSCPGLENCQRIVINFIILRKLVFDVKRVLSWK